MLGQLGQIMDRKIPVDQKNPTATSEEPEAKAGELSLHWTPPAAAAAAKVLQSCLTLCDPIDGKPTRLPRAWDSPGKNTGVGWHCLLQCVKVKSENEGA